MHAMRLPRSLAFKLVTTGLFFLLLALGSIALTLWVTWQLEGGAAAVNEAGRMRMMSYRLALNAEAGERVLLAPQVQALDATLELLASGDPARPLFVPWSPSAHDEFAILRAEWQTLRRAWLQRQPVTTAQVDALVRHIDRFVTLIEQRLSHWTGVLRAFQLTMVALAIGSAVLLLYTSHLMVLDPLRRLAQGLAAVREGEFHTRIAVVSRDEFGELAAGFNGMAERLASLYGDLEDKVREKTAKLEVKRERLAALYEVSAFVSRAETLDGLAQGFAALLRRIAQADAIAVRWADDDNRHYLMLAQEGLPPALTRAEQCQPSGECHCGQPSAVARTRVVPIRMATSAATGIAASAVARAAADAAGGAAASAAASAAATGSLNHCARAGFQTLVTVPVLLHQRVLGEIDLFFREPHSLHDDDRSMIETLASHLAGGIESLRAAAAGKEAAVAGERTLIAQELHDSIAQSLAFLKIQVQLLRRALQRGDDAAAARTLEEIDTGVRESYGDVRELLLHFRTRTAAQDITLALRSTLQKFEHQTGLPTTLWIEGHGVALPADVQVQVLHVLQEALSNVRKHARASHVTVRVQQTPCWRFEVEDDGHGFDADTPAGESHVGLRIMRERAQRIGAQVAFHSQAGRGTRVTITVPGSSAAGPGTEAIAGESALSQGSPA
jgi:two-component system, NarL family, nitrate/nitrite sensor histidine kinase NarX